MVKYGGASSARARPRGAEHTSQDSTTLRKPLKIRPFPQAGQRPRKPRPTAVRSGGIGHAFSGGRFSGDQRSVGMEVAPRDGVLGRFSRRNVGSLLATGRNTNTRCCIATPVFLLQAGIAGGTLRA